MPVRRVADSLLAQHVWDGIRVANAQRQMADQRRIVKYLQKVEKCSQEQAEVYFQQVLTDGLIMELHKITAKGAKVGTEVESYKIPIQEVPDPLDDDKDWYCIDCHLAGDVTPCRICSKVFHAECAHNKKLSSNKQSIDFNFTEGNSKSDLPLASSSPFLRDVNIDQNTGNFETSNDLLKEKLIEDIASYHDTSLDRLVNDVEKKLEKMEAASLMNSTSFTDFSTSSASDTLISQTDKENGISSSKNCDSVDLIDESKAVYDETLCSMCNMYKVETPLNLEKEELNTLLSFVHNRIKSWVPLNITDNVPPEAQPEWQTEAEVNWRARQLFHKPMNMVQIEAKLENREYSHICQFKTDVLTVRHNIAVYHGTGSQEFDCADFLWKDCHRELSELSNCVDCFRHSNEKINNKWFCLPCRVPHKLVWAKQKGYPYWPAKVIKEMDDICDVRFFGGKYERSVLPKMYIKPIAVNMGNLQSKKSSALMKSIEELHFHQKLLADPAEAEKYIAASRKKKQAAKTAKVVPINKVKKRSLSVDLTRDVYEFRDSPSHLEASTSGMQSSTAKRKRSTSPSAKGKLTTTKTADDAPKKSVQNQANKNKSTNNVKNGTAKGNSIANASLGFDEEQFAIRDEDYEIGKGCDGSHEEVSSSTEQIQSSDENYIKDNSDGVMPQTERQYSEAVEKTRRKLEQCRDKKQLIKLALECMQEEIDTIHNNHDEYVKKMFEAHNTQISETKKKQWCFNCEQDAIYHCCWNTAYCSPTCQQQHWQAEHKKVCRRKR